MKNLLILGIALTVVLSAGIAMAAGDQAPEMFQTLGQVQTVETTAITQMTDTDLNAVEGKMRYKGFRGYQGHKGGYTVKYYNTNTTYQTNECWDCSARGGKGRSYGGGGGNITQSNSNYTYQSN